VTAAGAAALDPVAACAALRGHPGRVLLHSGRDDDGRGRWSFVAADPVATLQVRGRDVVERDAAGAVVRAHAGDPLDAIERFVAAHGAGLGPDVRDPDVGGAPEPRVIGYLGYELGRTILPGLGRTARGLPRAAAASAERDGRAPDAWLAAYGAVARWRGDGEQGGPEVVGTDPAARARLAAALARPAAPGPPPRLGPLRADGGPDGSDDAGDAHRAAIARVLGYIGAGDVYQVNLARRLTAPLVADGDALALYRALDAAAPAPYAGLLEADGVRVVSGSPECFLSRAPGGRVVTCPIKGTRPRTGDPAHDRAAAAALAADPKDDAEHVMIVDLLRNDLGRVAVTGSVRVDRLGYLVELPHLFHKVSTVSATLRDDVGLAALLRATFPGGSITGAPKLRAMEIIEELEPAPRGPYCGAIGLFGAGGAIELAIAIRVAVLAGDALRLHVGGGIVADSTPEGELAETEDKAAGWRRALANL
jgi:para-aminobenzoate synthetase component 1